jgi:uncharacterized membrane protein
MNLLLSNKEEHKLKTRKPITNMKMNIKRIFGTILTGLGVIALIYAAILFVNSTGSTTRDIKALIIYGVLGLIFFSAGLGLIKTTRDEE